MNPALPPSTSQIMGTLKTGLGGLATLQNRGSFSAQTTLQPAAMPEATLPSWLTTNPDKLVSELMSEYTGAGKYFDTTGIQRGYNKSINTAMGMGGQIADNAMREAMARAGQEGGASNSAMVKAQAMLPVYEHTSGLRKEREMAIADMRTREANMRSDLARALGGMRASYLGMLAQTYQNQQQITNQWAQSQQGFGLQQAEFNLRSQLAQRQAAQSSQAQAPVAPFQGQITRAPNNSGLGGVEFTPQYKSYLAAMGVKPDAAPPQYPAGGGVGFGGSLDQYNAQMRQLAAQATGRPAYNSEMLDFGASFGGYDPNGFRGEIGIDPLTGQPTYTRNGKPIVRKA